MKRDGVNWGFGIGRHTLYEGDLFDDLEECRMKEDFDWDDFDRRCRFRVVVDLWILAIVLMVVVLAVVLVPLPWWVGVIAVAAYLVIANIGGKEPR